MIGATLSHFKVTAKLGEGGMGEVYRAEDTKLGREVAIKVLPADLAADPVRLERFAREAKAVAALDHPNIVAVHEIEQADGIHFIAMQLVEGKTLAQVIPAGGMALEQIFATAIPLADALSAAHEAGVVHRDLKPGNIMVGSDGRVRILDFGLAKLQADPSQPGSTQLGTEMLTTEGQIIGTVAYMSPEQAEGRVTDSRTDIFSLGVLLYQMATGRLPFRGETQISTITGIIRDSPTPITQLREELPWHLGRIVKRALDKDPERRYQSAKDLRNDLENLRAEVASGELSAGGERMMAAAAAATEAARESSRGIGGWAVAAALLLAALAGGYLLGHSSAGSEGRATPSTGLELKQVSYSAGFESWPSLTPDGEWAVYGGREAGDLDVYLQSVGGYKPINLTEDSRFDDYEPALSPDGQRIAFRSERQGGGIFVMQRTGESVRRVAAIGYSPAWSPDGRSLVIATEHIPGMPYSRATLSQLWRLDLDSAEQSLLTEGDAVEPRWSPNGARIVFWGLQRNSGQRDLFTIPVAGGDPQPLTNDPATDWSPAWAPDGRSIYFASDRSGAMNMWRIPVDESSGEALGPPEQITSGGAAWSVRPFFSQNGRRMAFSEGRWRYDVYRLPLDPQTGRAQGAMELVLGGPRNTLFPAVSPDGQRLAFSTSVGQQEDLFVVRLDGTGLTQLTDDLAKDRGARWSPSGDRLAFYSDRSGTYGIWLVNADGSGLQPVGVSTSLPADRPLWSPDGTRLAYVVRDELANKSTTLVLDLSRPVGEDNPRALPALPADRMIFNPSAWSADGDRLLGAFVSPSGGLAEIACYSLTAEEYRISNHQGEYPMWLGDGRRAIFFALDTLYLLDTSSDEIVELASVAPGTVGDYPSVSTDDRWFYFTLQTPEFDVWIADLGREN